MFFSKYFHVTIKWNVIIDKFKIFGWHLSLQISKLVVITSWIMYKGPYLNLRCFSFSPNFPFIDYFAPKKPQFFFRIRHTICRWRYLAILTIVLCSCCCVATTRGYWNLGGIRRSAGMAIATQRIKGLGIRFN